MRRHKRRIKLTENQLHTDTILIITLYTEVFLIIVDLNIRNLYPLYIHVHIGDATASNNSIKKLIVPATFNKVGQETGSRSCQKVKEILITRAILPGASSPVSGYKQHVPQAVEAPHVVFAAKDNPNGKRFQL